MLVSFDNNLLSIIMKKANWTGISAIVLICIFLNLSCNNSVQKDHSDKSHFKVEHVIQGYLGPNHLANLVYRKGIDGDKFVGWGRTPITEWPVGSANRRQVVPSHPDKRYSNGGCAMDLDGDGIDEIIVACGSMANLSDAALVWFKEVDGEQYWEEYEIARIWPRGHTAPHDIVPYIKQTEAGEVFKAVLANKGRNEMHMFVVPEDPRDKWPHYVIGNFPVNNQSGIELADINGDGNIDIVSGNFWLEAPVDPTQVPWKFHRFCDWDDMGKNNWGGMNMHVVADFTGDGFRDMIVVEAEIPDSRISLFVRTSDDGTGLWEEFPLEGGIDVPHSLIAADLNNNSRMDFIVGEMTAGGWDFPMNPNPKLYAFINKGKGKFEKLTLYEGWGVHEMRLFPELFRGKIMIYGADEIQPHKFENMNTHVSYWMISSE